MDTIYFQKNFCQNIELGFSSLQFEFQKLILGYSKNSVEFIVCNQKEKNLFLYERGENTVW